MNEKQQDNRGDEQGQEDRFAWQVIDSLGQGVTIIDADGRFRYVNPAYAHMVGHAPADLIGKFPADFTHPDDIVLLEQAWQERLSNRTSSYETRLVRPDGRIIYAHVTGVPHRQNGVVAGSYAIVTDLTAQKQAEEAYRTLVDYSLQGIMIIQDSRVVFANRRVTEIGGYTEKELLNWPLEQVMEHVYEADRAAVAARLQAHLAGEPAPAQMVLRIYHKDGRIRWVEAYTRHTRYRGRPATQVAYLDITERKEAEARLLQEKKFSEAIIDSMPDIFCVFDDRGQLLRWNKNLEASTGYTSEEVAEMQPLDFVVEADRANLVAKIQEVFAQGAAMAEGHFVSKDGRQRPFLFIGRRFLVDGRPHVAGVGLDISDRKEAEEALRASEERYRFLVNSVGDIIFQMDLACRWTFLNQTWTEITGFTVAESLGQSYLQHIYADDHGENEIECRALLAKEKEFCQHQVRYLTRDGGFRWLEVHARRLEDAEGQVQGVTGLLRDITERKLRQRELESMVAVTQALRLTNTRQQILPVILDQTVDLLQAGGAMFISHAHPETRVVELAWGDWQALSDEIVPPETKIADFRPDDGELYFCLDARSNLPEPAAALIHPHYALLGAPVMSNQQVAGVLWAGRPQPFSAVEGRSLQAIAGLMAAALDRARLLETLEQQVVERTRALAAANERLHELDRLKNKFINDISHELRTPATNIGLYLELLARSSAERQEGYLGTLRQSSRQLNEIIDSILQFTNLTEKTVGQPTTMIDLNQITAVVIEDFRDRAQAADITLVWTPGTRLPPVQGMSGLLTQAIAYLLDNAVKYTAAAAVSGRIEIGVWPDAEQGLVGVHIKDNGIGIDADELTLIFDRFYRSRRVSQLTMPGAGLGLSLAQQIAAQHGGRIDVESQVDVGTAVTLWLPSLRGGPAAPRGGS